MSTETIKYGREVIEQEIQGLQKLLAELGENFDSAVKLISGLTPGSHVIVGGVGKAGIIGMKISATLASTGVPSFFLHPAEAVHGDLGRFSRNDLALILSNSGETEEIIRILPSIRLIGCPIISITGNTTSTLAKYSDIVLSIGEQDEAGPHALAPTTTTLLMLALGDALAMTIFKDKNLSAEQFAFFHPGGNLGRKLVKVQDVMRTKEKLCVVTESTSIKNTIHQISATSGRPGAAAIVNAAGKLCGVFTDGDLRRCLDKEISLAEPVSVIMGKTPKSILNDRLAFEALKLLREHQIDQVIVCDQNMTPLGMIDIQDLQFLGFN